MSGSNLHTAITALTAAFVSAGIAGLSITDGPNWDPETECLEVAWAGSDNEGAEVARRGNNASGAGAQEAITVWCRLSCWDGDKSVPEARAVLDGILTELVGVVEAGVTLGGVVSMTAVTEIRYSPRRVEGGAEAWIDFSVAVIAFA